MNGGASAGSADMDQERFRDRPPGRSLGIDHAARRIAGRAAARKKDDAMTRLFTSRFTWQFAGGFLLGAIGMVAAHAAQPELPANPYAATAAVVR